MRQLTFTKFELAAIFEAAVEDTENKTAFFSCDAIDEYIEQVCYEVGVNRRIMMKEHGRTIINVINEYKSILKEGETGTLVIRIK